MDENVKDNISQLLSDFKNPNVSAPLLQAFEYYNTHGGAALHKKALENPIRPILRNSAGQGLFHLGDLTGIKAQVGNGKTLAASLFASAALGGAHDFGLDPQIKVKVLYFDTELSDTLTDAFQQRVIKRAGESANRFFPVNMQDNSTLKTATERQNFVKNFIDYQLAVEPDIPVFAILDGVVELVDDSNGMVENKKFLEDLADFAAHRKVNIFNVIHENQGNDGGKATGNIGSFLYKKVREMYKVSRDGDVFTIENNANRNGCKYQYGSGVKPIAFRVTETWDIEPTEPVEKPKAPSPRERKYNIFKMIFSNTETWSRTNLQDKYEEKTDTKKGSGKKAVQKALTDGILIMDDLGRIHLGKEEKKAG